MVLFNDLLSFPFVLLNKNWGEGEAPLSKIPVPAQSGQKLVSVPTSNAANGCVRGPNRATSPEREGPCLRSCRPGCSGGS